MSHAISTSCALSVSNDKRLLVRRKLVKLIEYVLGNVRFGRRFCSRNSSFHLLFFPFLFFVRKLSNLSIS